MPAGSAGEANHAHVELNLGITFRCLAHGGDNLANRIVQGLDLPADGHGSRTIKQPDDMEWSASIFSTGSHRHISYSPVSLAGNKAYGFPPTQKRRRKAWL